MDKRQTVFHLHPLNKCNLSCLHCYSDSSPSGREALDPVVARSAIRMAARWGYESLAISGGEPMLYPSLPSLLQEARSQSMTTSLITNGWRIGKPDDLKAIRDFVDVVSVSMDGLEPAHDRMRGRVGSYAAARGAIGLLLDAGVQTWISCGVHQGNLDDIEALTELAIDWGVHGITFHVVAPVGRATAMAASHFLTHDDEVLLFTMAKLLSACNKDRISIRVDLSHRDQVVSNPRLFYQAEEPAFSLLSEAVDILVLQFNGSIYPKCFGFNPKYALGQYTPDWEHEWPVRWETLRLSRLAELNRLGKAVFDEVIADDSLQVLNPAELMATRSWR